MFGHVDWVTLSLLVCLSGRLISPGGASSGKKCSFPSEWRGRYYQTGLGDVVIRDNFITTKGTCVEQNNRDYFLFHNRESQCYHCLLILRQHRNIIQYKESYCTSVANMTVVCNQIRVETTLYTMVKEPTASGVRCPFHDAFNFTYNDMTSDFCAKTESYAKPCVSETRYQLLFRHCTGSALYNEKEFHLECLATWKDGSEMYLYGKLSGPGLITKDDRYRCFKYQNYGSEVSLAMSADTSCRGLRSASDGPFLMRFSKDSLRSRPTSTCQYPDWLRGITWRSLDGKTQYSLDDKSEIFSEYFRSQGGQLQRINEFRCTDNLNAVGINTDEVNVVTFTSHKCASKHQCIRLKRIGNQVVEFFQGPWVEIPGTYERCISHSYDEGHLLISDDQTSLSPCPRPGIYTASAPETCTRRIEVGCQSDSVTEVHDRCHGPLTVATLECLWSWNYDSKTFLIARSRSSGNLNCFSFRRDVTSQSDSFGLDLSCTGNQTASWEGWESPFRLHKHEPCMDKDKSTTASIDGQLARTDRLPVPRPSSTRSPEQELNLYADGVQPRRRSKLPPLFNEEEDDEDEIYSGNEADEEEGEEEEEEREPEVTLFRNTQRAPLDRLPVTRRRILVVSTPPTVFQISSSPRRGNSAKHGPKSVSSLRERSGSEDHDGPSQRGQGKVDTDQGNSCGRLHQMQCALVQFIIFTGLLLLGE